MGENKNYLYFNKLDIDMFMWFMTDKKVVIYIKYVHIYKVVTLNTHFQIRFNILSL